MLDTEDINKNIYFFFTKLSIRIMIGLECFRIGFRWI